MADRREVLEDVKNLLEYAKTLGMTEVRDSEESETGNRKTENRKQKTGTAGDKAKALEKLRAETGECLKCKLGRGRKNLVFGVGNPDADLMFIGEAPGADEDEQGIPFVGRAGQLLTKIILAMGFKREDVYIANICKCRPPSNRNPEPDEVAACMPWLIKQAEIIEPKVIVCLGSVATQNLLGTEEKITRLRGKFAMWHDIPVMPTYHPAFLLRNPAMKKPAWEDMQNVMKMLGMEPVGEKG
ncbi:MAG: uracil-DNA glycosylase [Pseudomonadota bacterium]